jgi:hemoglobin-like flavoprotein
VLALLVIVGVAMFGPVAVMMGRDMFGRRKQETAMSEQAPEDTQVGLTDEAAAASHAGEHDAQPLPAVERGWPDGEIDAAAEARWRAEGIPTETVGNQDTELLVVRGVNGPTGRTMGRSTVPASLISPTRIDCEHCKGVGYVPGINDWLVESAALIGDRGDEVVRLFYTNLLTAHPELAYLFPPDITEITMATRNEQGLSQRDKLLQAIVALSELYDPGVPGKMDRLNGALARFGRAHAAFVRQDGTTWGATLEEYAAVKDALFSTLVRVAGELWRPEYTSAWSQAYDYAAAVMLAEQFRSGFVAPRFPRA